MPSIIVFPGQGSQFVGMGKKLLHIPKVKRMFELASSVFKYDLESVCLNGPKSKLDQTNVCQPAVFVTSLAAVEYLKETNPQALKECYATAGFSVGEYASLVLADSITFEDALTVLKARCEAMQKASEEKPSGLMSVFLGRTSNLNTAMLAARKWCKEKLKLDEPIVCEIANYLFAQCKVIGGNKEALDFIELNHKEFNINRVKRLAVSGAFHTELMRSAQEPLALALKSIHIKKPIVKFYSNYTANLCTNPYQIKTNLIRQVSEPVKWEQILNQFYYDQNLPKENESGEQIKEDFLNDYELTSEEREEMNKKMVAQSAHRIYPDIYECGPASQTGPILRSINKKAFQLYKHVDV